MAYFLAQSENPVLKWNLEKIECLFEMVLNHGSQHIRVSWAGAWDAANDYNSWIFIHIWPSRCAAKYLQNLVSVPRTKLGWESLPLCVIKDSRKFCVIFIYPRLVVFLQNIFKNYLSRKRNVLKAFGHFGKGKNLDWENRILKVMDEYIKIFCQILSQGKSHKLLTYFLI